MAERKRMISVRDGDGVLIGHVIDELRKLPEKSVHCCVTSPPYWGLRSYGTEPQIWGGDPGCQHDWGDPLSKAGGGGQPTEKVRWQHTGAGPNGHPVVSAGALCAQCGAWRGELGAEPTPEQFVQNIVAVFAEVWRVLRDDGTCWVNIGDSYANDGKWGGEAGGKQSYLDDANRKRVGREKRRSGLKPKDLVGIPWMVAFALRAAGWYLRADIIWGKRNPMPESTRDRPSKAHEYVFLLSKRERYFYDSIAVREPLSSVSVKRLTQPTFDQQTGGAKDYGSGQHTNENRSARRALCNLRERLIAQEKFGDRHAVWDERDPAKGRNLRSVWMIASAPFKGAHFATYPPALVLPCIKAGTSEYGCCPECGAPWRRVTERKRVATRPGTDTKLKTPGVNSRLHVDCDPQHSDERKKRKDVPDPLAVGNRDPQRHVSVVETTGWEPTCECGSAERVPCTVLDPFLGSGTTAAVAEYLGRNWIGCELNAEYAALAQTRIAEGYRPPKASRKRQARRLMSRLQGVLFP